jgi:hypothetical protein
MERLKRGRDLGKEVVDAVDGQVEGGESAREEASPPPVVVLDIISFVIVL